MYSQTERPRRPAIPPALYALATTLLVERAVLVEGAAGAAGFAGKAVAALAALCGVVCLALHGSGHDGPVAWAITVALSAAAALMLASICLLHGQHAAVILETKPVSSWDFVIASDPTEHDGSYRSRATACLGDERADVWLTLPDKLPRGSVVRCVGRFSPLGDDEWAASSRAQGVWGTVRAIRIERVNEPGGMRGVVGALRTRVVRSIDPTSKAERALLAGVVCGFREGLDEHGLRDVFSRCGIAHLIAVSGGHLSVLTMMLSSLMESLQVRRRTRACVTMAVGGAFVVFCGTPVSAVRAYLMACASLVGGIVGRRSHALSAVSVMALAMALVDPTLSGQLGFTLSVVSVAALSLLSPYASYVVHTLVGTPAFPPTIPKRVRRALFRTWNSLRDSVATSVLVLVATLPLTVGAFGEFSLVGPLANALLSVPFSLLVGLGVVAACLWWAPPLQAVALAACDVVGAAIVWVARRLSTLPGASLAFAGNVRSLALVVAGLGILLLVWWPKVSRAHVRTALAAMALAATVLVVRWRYLAPARICVLDIGQGDAILVQEGARALLVDAGPDEAIAAALARNHVLHLDAVLVTHLHADHYGGVAHMAGHVGCDQVLVAAGVADSLPHELKAAMDELGIAHAEELSYGDSLRVGGFALRMVSPVGEVDGTENAHSIELLTSFDGDGRTLTALLTGDAERDEMAGLIERGDVGDIDLLKVGHHGSEVSLTAEQARAIDAEVAVASAGEGNSYGHPRRECVEALETSGSLFLCTKDVGDVEVRPGIAGPIVRCQRR